MYCIAVFTVWDMAVQIWHRCITSFFHVTSLMVNDSLKKQKNNKWWKTPHQERHVSSLTQKLLHLEYSRFKIQRLICHMHNCRNKKQRSRCCTLHPEEFTGIIDDMCIITPRPQFLVTDDFIMTITIELLTHNTQLNMFHTCTDTYSIRKLK